MEFLIDLWLPIVVGSIVLFFCSFLAWAILPHHFLDHQQLPVEDELMDFLRDKQVPTGSYLFPYVGSGKEQGAKAYVDRYNQGPRGTIYLYAIPSMAANMIQTVAFYFVTVLTIGYITHVACPPGVETTDFWRVFRIAGTIGVLTYASTGICNKIWFKRKIWTEFVDGIVFGLILGLIFALLWPAS